MKSAAGLIIGAVLFAVTPAGADVRDDFRICERKILSRLPRGVQPQASNADEEYCLGLGYWFESPGNRLPRDPAKAVYWHTKAVEHGSRQAKVTLAYHYEKGHGVAADIPKAVALYKSAAEEGDASAMFNLGRLYSIGRGVPKDEAESERWFQLAKQGGSADAVVNDRKTNQYKELESAARDVYEAAYKAYNAKNYSEAAKLFTEAQKAGNASASVALGQLYRQGIGVPKDARRATELYREAALRGHARGQVQLGLSYELGEGVEENWAEAINWYKKSAMQLDALGLYSMGRAYQFGIGVPQDRATAVKFFEKSANQDEQQAAFFAKWLSNPTSCLGYLSDQEREKFLGICSDPKGITFHNSRERTAWLADAMSKVKVDFFGANSYQQGACGASGGDFRQGNCYGSGGVMFEPGTQDRNGKNLW